MQPTDLNLRHLDAAAAVGRLGSITAAALAVNLSQPTVTQALATLETRLGHRLFDRQPGGVTPTPAGTVFVGRVERAIARLSQTCRVVRRAARSAPLPYPERLLTMTQLRAFLGVERNGSYTLAARELGLAQPSVHRAAGELEDILGTPLFIRVGQRMRATPAGDRLAGGIRLALVELRAGLDELAALSAAGAGRIVIGTLPLPRARLLPEALARCADRSPQAEISVVEGPYPDLLSGLRNGEIDFLIGALRDPGPGKDIVQQRLFDDDLFVVAATRHPLAGRAASLDDLARYPWIIAPPGSPMRRTWETMFAERTKPERRIECGSILVIRGMLLAGNWLALMSADQFPIEKRAGLLAAIGPSVPGSRRSIGLATRADWRPTETQAALIATLFAVAAERE